MKALLTARRVKKGHEEEFRTRWRGGASPDGMLDAFLLEDEQDPRETLSISFWDTAQQLLKYRTSEEARKREDTLASLVDKDRWRRSFVAFGSWDIPTAGKGKPLWLVLPLLLAGAGAGLYFLMKKRGERADEWDEWAPEPAESYQPPEVLAGTPSVPSIDPDGRNGERHVSAGAGGAMPARPATATSPSVATGTPAHGQAGAAAATAGTATATRPAMRGRAQTVADVMTPNPETVDQMADTATAARRMRELNVGVLPVLADGRLAGLITDRDIALGVSAQARRPDEVRVQELMTTVPTTVRPDASVEEASRLMADRQIRRLPVVDGARLVGILSLGDLATEGDQAAAGNALREISEPASPDR